MNSRHWIGLLFVVLASISAALALPDDWGGPAAGRSHEPFRASGPVHDMANIISDADERQIVARLSQYNATNWPLVVATVPDLGREPIESYAETLLDGEWTTDDERLEPGVLLLVASNNREVRIQVDRRLRATVPDDLADQIVQDELVPRFRSADFAGGVDAAVNVLIARLEDAAAVRRSEEYDRMHSDRNWWDWANILTLFFFLAFGGPIYWGVRHFVHLKF